MSDGYVRVRIRGGDDKYLRNGPLHLQQLLVPPERGFPWP